MKNVFFVLIMLVSSISLADEKSKVSVSEGEPKVLKSESVDSTISLSEKKSLDVVSVLPDKSGNKKQETQEDIDHQVDREASEILSESRTTVNKIKKTLPDLNSDRKKSFEELDDTLNILLKSLVQEGVISEGKAKEVTDRAQRNAIQAAKAGEKTTFERIVRVPYVPESVKKNLRDEIRSDLRGDVLEDVINHARSQRWGIPGAQPDWTKRIKWKGDFRMRAENQFMDNNNSAFLDYSRINDKGGILSAGNDAFANTTIDRARARIRMRLTMSAKISTNMKASARFATGSSSNPVSTNQTLGKFGQSSSVQFDRAYFQYDGIDLDAYNWMNLKLGRFSNPWYGTDLVWDSDLAFEGLHSKFRANLSGGDDLEELTDQTKSIWLGIGAFPIQEIALSQDDKWLLGAQLGSEFIFENQSKLTLGVAYYDFVNLQGKRFNAEDNKRDPTYYLSDFMQKGNTLFDMREDTDTSKDLWGLASDYNVVNATMGLDLATFAPIHVVLTLDYAKNIAYDADKIAKLTEQSATSAVIDEKTNAYQFKVSVGWPRVELAGKWRVSGAYKYIERDAVLDAFTDSDFHLGGTNTKGWWLGLDYGVEEMTWISLKWITADEIDGAPLALDLLQLDFNTKF